MKSNSSPVSGSIDSRHSDRRRTQHDFVGWQNNDRCPEVEETLSAYTSVIELEKVNDEMAKLLNKDKNQITDLLRKHGGKAGEELKTEGK